MAAARRCEGKARQGDGETGQSDVKARRGGGKAKNAEHRNGPDPQRQSMEQIRFSSVWRGQSREKMAMDKQCQLGDGEALPGKGMEVRTDYKQRGGIWKTKGCINC